jgi:cytochrome c biogenesis protein CcmG, thiol:disulfide interchange protein DsbE
MSETENRNLSYEKLPPGLQEPSETEAARPKRALTPGTIVLLIGILAVVVVIGVQLANQNATQPRSGPAPDFTIDLYTGDGSFTLSEQRGKFVVVNFWGSWCAPCRDEAPYLQAAHEDFQDRGVQIVGVGFRDTERAAMRFLEETNTTYPTGPDTGLRITASYNIVGAPETFIVDPDGNIVDFYLGPLTADWLDTRLNELLAENEAAS